MSTVADLIPTERIQNRIRVVRGLRVLLDADLAAIYEVPTKRLLEQMRRNSAKFPEDFAFRLTREEFINLKVIQSSGSDNEKVADLRSQNATSRQGHGGRRYLPYAFAEPVLSESRRRIGFNANR